jgi:hypothetical protein
MFVKKFFAVARGRGLTTETPQAQPFVFSRACGVSVVNCFGCALAGRPGERAAAEDVEVYVEDRLARARARVDDGAVAALRESFLGGDARRGEEESAEEGLVGVGGVGERGDVAARDDEDVGGGLRVDVAEGEGVLVRVDDLRGDFARGDLAEETVLLDTHEASRENAKEVRF